MTRLDRFVADATGASRSDVKKWLRAGRILVSDTVVRSGSTTVPAECTVTLDGEALESVPLRYLMLNKAVSTVCTALHADPRSVLNGFPVEGKRTLQCVGRLDLDTTGLLLVSDDGAWHHRMSRPGTYPKVYRAELAEPLPDDAIEQLLLGVLLRGEQRCAVATAVERVDGSTVSIEVTEGRYHLVKRMFAAVGNKVVALHRESVGPVVLDPTLAPGEWRALTPIERSDTGCE